MVRDEGWSTQAALYIELLPLRVLFLIPCRRRHQHGEPASAAFIYHY